MEGTTPFGFVPTTGEDVESGRRRCPGRAADPLGLVDRGLDVGEIHGCGGRLVRPAWVPVGQALDRRTDSDSRASGRIQ